MAAAAAIILHNDQQNPGDVRQTVAAVMEKRGSVRDYLGRRMSALDQKSDKNHRASEASSLHTSDSKTKKSLAGSDSMRAVDAIFKPEEKDVFKKFFNSGNFDMMICPLILLNVMLIGVEVDLSGDTSADMKTTWLIINSIWNIIWFLEFALKIYCLGKAYFDYGFNRFDCFLLLTSFIDTWILPVMPGQFGKVLSEWALTVRMLRILRLIRFVRMFENLWHIVDGFIKALNPLGWTLLLMFIINFSCGVYMTLVVGHACDDVYAEWGDCDAFFGKVVRSMWTLIQVTTFDSWSSGIARYCIAQKPFLVLFFMAYIMLCVFGLLNIIVGIIVESTLESKKDVERERTIHKLHDNLDTMKQIFLASDNDGSGGIDYDEFCEGIKNEKLHEMFESLGLDIDTNPEIIFDILDDDHSGFITIEQFIEGLLKLKNPPSKLDVWASALHAQTKGRMDLMPDLEDSFRSMMSEDIEGSNGIAMAKTPSMSKSERRKNRPNSKTKAGPGTGNEGASSSKNLGESSETSAGHAANAQPTGSKNMDLASGSKLESENDSHASALVQGLELAQRGLQDAQIVQQQALESISKAMSWLIQDPKHKADSQGNTKKQELRIASAPLLSPDTNHEEHHDDEFENFDDQKSGDNCPKRKVKTLKGKAKAKDKKQKGTAMSSVAEDDPHSPGVPSEVHLEVPAALVGQDVKDSASPRQDPTASRDSGEGTSSVPATTQEAKEESRADSPQPTQHPEVDLSPAAALADTTGTSRRMSYSLDGT